MQLWHHSVFHRYLLCYIFSTVNFLKNCFYLNYLRFYTFIFLKKSNWAIKAGYLLFLSQESSPTLTLFSSKVSISKIEHWHHSLSLLDQKQIISCVFYFFMFSFFIVFLFFMCILVGVFILGVGWCMT